MERKTELYDHSYYFSTFQNIDQEKLVDIVSRYFIRLDYYEV